jgi:two-component system OmpR family sensor kinase
MSGRLSLRARLVLGALLLCAAGLAAANVATYTSLRSFLLDRTDSALRATQGDVEHTVENGTCDGDGRPPPGVGAGTLIELRRADGSVVCSTQVTRFTDTAPAPPRLPDTLTIANAERERYFTVGARSGHGRYRVRVSAAPHGDGVLVVAAPLGDVDATLRRLLMIELLVAAAVLAALAALGLWVVRIGLRPLDAIGSTAAAIAGGDLSRRVERAEERTEVGRLGLALNAMLGQIESAFRSREASEQKLRRFVADASHELRTPLTAVRAYAELFERGAAQRPEDLARSMAGITREAERMSLLVDDLLLLARLDEGRPLERERVELEQVVAEAVETALAVEPDRPLTFDAAAATVIGDRNRLRQIVDNLLANVRAHTPAGAPVHVRLRSAAGEAVIDVEDSGPGLADGEAQRVFERFYRADASRARASGGVGLGLSIVAAVAEAHGGRVAADSRRDGATFTIALPLAPPAR